MVGSLARHNPPSCGIIDLDRPLWSFTMKHEPLSSIVQAAITERKRQSSLLVLRRFTSSGSLAPKRKPRRLRATGAISLEGAWRHRQVRCTISRTNGQRAALIPVPLVYDFFVSSSAKKKRYSPRKRKRPGRVNRASFPGECVARALGGSTLRRQLSTHALWPRSARLRNFFADNKLRAALCAASASA